MAEIDLVRLAANIRMHREARGLTQAGLGERASTCRDTIASIENRVVDPRISTLLYISDALQVDMRRLLRGVWVNDEEPL